MLCPRCRRQLSGRSVFCPFCGMRLVAPPIKRPEVVARSRTVLPEQPERTNGRGCSLTLAVLVLTLVAILAVAGIGAAGFYAGLNDRATVERQAANEHINRGVEYLQQGQYELAIAELELANQLDPQNQEAQARLQEAIQARERKPSPMPQEQPDTRAIYFQELLEANARGDWAQVQATGEQLRVVDSAYQREAVETMLAHAMYQGGLQLLREERLQEALRLLEKSLTLRPDEEEVQKVHVLAERYLKGMAYWNADWARAIEELAAVYDQSPTFQDVGQRLYQAHVNYGDFLASQGDWCLAEEQYAAALAISMSEDLVELQRTATTNCNTGATPVSTAAAKGPAVLLGTFVGAVARMTPVDSNKVMFRGQVLDRKGSGVNGIQVEIRAWNWSTTAITSGNGEFSFDGLRDPVTYTLSLTNVQGTPVDAAGKIGQITWVEFRQK